MRFAALPYIYLLWCVPALVGLYCYAFVRKRQALAQFMDLALAPRLLPAYSRLRQWGKAICLIGAVACLVLGLMQPQWGKRWQEVPRRGRDLMILLDVSRSMLARDVIPNRLQRAKLDIKDLVHVLHREGGHRLGLVVFAGRASLQCPLTSDYAFFLQKLNQVGPDTVGQGGTLIGDAIRKALQGFGTLEHNFKDIILITDGEDHDSFPLEAAKAAAAQRVSIYAIGLGDPQVGTRIPVAGDAGQGKFVRYRGEEVRSRMQENLLLEIARLTGGAYVPAATRAIELDRIYAQYVAPKARREFDVTSRERYVHRFQWFVLAALLLMAVEALIRERRMASPPGSESKGASRREALIVCLIGALLLIRPAAIRAASPYAAVREGNALYQASQYDEANARYAAAEAALPHAPEIHFNRGNAFFKQGDYGEAFKHYSKALQGAPPELERRLKYNLGNVKYQEALQSLQAPQNAIPHLRAAMTYYRDSLEVDDQQQDARYNLELAQRLLKQLEQQQNQSQRQQNQQSQDQQPQNQQQQERQQNTQQPQNQQRPQDQQPSSAEQPQRDAAQQPAEQDATSSDSQPESQTGRQDTQQPEQRTAHEMTPEEAIRLLQSIRERGREADEQRQQRHRARMQYKRVEKDW